jgi:prepilin-type N-terminal cleavage/methylation domain-containing protein
MRAQSTVRGFTLIELLVVVTIIGVLISILLPAIGASRERSRRLQCENKIRQIGLALRSFEAQRRRFPVVSTNRFHGFDPLKSAPASRSSNSLAGFSWIVEILSNLEERKLFDFISRNSMGLSASRGSFDPIITNGIATYQHASCVTLSVVICPGWAGDGYTNRNTTIDIGSDAGSPPGYGAPEYASVNSNTPGTGRNNYQGKVGATNYKAMLGTHINKKVIHENGGFVLSSTRGLSLAAFLDGTSKTILCCETKESGYASWYDGTLNWLVGNDPNQVPPGTGNLQNDVDSPPWATPNIALDKGYSPQFIGNTPPDPYLLRRNSPVSQFNDMWWGPSSDHRGGIVNHVFADGHVSGIGDECDGATYLALVTRNDGEPIDETKIK